jgi:hypothetical protein
VKIFALQNLMVKFYSEEQFIAQLKNEKEAFNYVFASNTSLKNKNHYMAIHILETICNQNDSL